MAAFIAPFPACLINTGKVYSRKYNGSEVSPLTYNMQELYAGRSSLEKCRSNTRQPVATKKKEQRNLPWLIEIKRQSLIYL